jgi:hypothetical protein
MSQDPDKFDRLISVLIRWLEFGVSLLKKEFPR